MTRAVDHPPALTEERAAEDMLHAVRRADWRFLLPNPQLDDVAYVAPHDPELGAALERVARSVVLLDGRDDAGGSHDVVVATRASAGSAPALAALTRPGGWVYVETPGRASARWARALRREGLEEVEVVWLWPNAAAPREMVPLHDDAAVRHALGRRDPGARLRPRAWAARALLAAHALPLAVPAAAVVGRRPLSSSGDAS
jgi:hypothetical protein